MPPRPLHASRRTTLGAALVGLVGLVAVTGCDLDDLDPRSDPAPSGAPGTTWPSAAPEDADTTLVAGVVVELTAALSAASGVRRRDRASLRPLVRLHRRHLAELDAPAAAGGTTPPAAAADVVGREQQLQQRLADAAVEAQSGELARVLASMSAAVAQQLAVLPATGRRLMAEVDALQTVLAAEHAAVYVYGALGAQTSQSAQPTLFAALQAAYDVHVDRRDQLVADVTALEADPVGAAPAYELPADLGTPDAVAARARELEAACAATYGFWVGSTTGVRRQRAVEALTDAAVRGLGFGAAPEDLPGT